jgi:hypothetical protein
MNPNRSFTMFAIPFPSPSRFLGFLGCHSLPLARRQAPRHSTRRFVSLLTAISTMATVCADPEPLAPQPQPTLTETTPGAWRLDWNGVPERTYFVQTSVDLVNWDYEQVMAFGDGTWTIEDLGSTSPKYFVRLVYADETWIGDLQEAKDADFDNDGIPNYYEVHDLHTNPLDKNSAGGDSDNDGLPDGWELYHFGGLGIADPNAALQPDGLTNKDKAELGLNPNTDYSAANATQPATYSYDPVGRLTGVTAPVGAGGYTPDEEGNILGGQ